LLEYTGRYKVWQQLNISRMVSWKEEKNLFSKIIKLTPVAI
jgi:hypothetical protein